MCGKGFARCEVIDSGLLQTAAATPGPLSDIAPFVDLSATAVLLAVVFYLIRVETRGDRVSKRELDYVRQDRDDRLAEKELEIARERTISAEWRAAHETSEQARELQDNQLRDALDALREQRAFFDAFRSLASRSGPFAAGSEGPGALA